MNLKFYFSIFFSFLLGVIEAQNITQTIKGKVVYKETQSPLPGATIVVLNSNLVIGAVSDIDGIIIIKNIPIGRYGQV